MERATGRRGVSRADAAKEKLAALAAAKVAGKKRVETFEVKREEAVYDEARGWRSLAGCRRAGARLPVGSRPALRRPRSWTSARTPRWWPSGGWRRAASWWATRTAGARGAGGAGKLKGL